MTARGWKAGGRTGTRARPRTARGGRSDAPAARRDRGEAALRPGEKRRLRQMAVSALILAAVVLCKLAVPGIMEEYRVQILSLLGEDTDFAAAFSSVGRAISPDGSWGEALNDAYTAVFGRQEVPAAGEAAGENAPGAGESAAASDRDDTPEDVCLTQQILGFAYATPLEGTITDRFGFREPASGSKSFHYGVDIAADSGAVIRSFAAGTVTVVGESSTLGKYVIVAHPGEYSSLYAHCSRITASSGQQVALGDPIAEVGETGQATGPHLHFELQKDTVYLNPIYYVGR